MNTFRYHIHLENSQYTGVDVRRECCSLNNAISEAVRLHALLDGEQDVSVWDDKEKRYIVEKPGRRSRL